jgi:agmatine/peptidylarginine deiminase
MKTVYIAAVLRDRHPDVHLALSKALAEAGIPLVEVQGTGNIWIRDWMPIRCGDHYVKFRNHTNDTKRWPQLEVPEEAWMRPVLLGDVPIIHSDLILDGGNVVRSPDGKRVIMTKQVLRDNPGLILKKLGDLLEAEIVLIDPEPGDTLGHSDGICHWIDNDTVFVNDYRSMRDSAYRDYAGDLRVDLDLDWITAVPMPNAYDECRDLSEERFRTEFPDADDFNPGYGYYINFLKVENLILYPTFGIDRDERCLDALLDAWPAAKCVGIDCSRLSMEGGLLHCITREC